MSDEFAGVLINLIYEAEREQDAKRVARELEVLGAVISLTKVEEGRANRKHCGKVYYFRRGFSQAAARIADMLSTVEKFTPELYVSKNPAEIQHSIWIVKNTRQRKSFTPKLTKPVRTYEICPICNVSIKSDRLQRHKDRAHINAVTKKAKKVIGVTSRKARCRHCGKLAIPGSDTCYSCS